MQNQQDQQHLQHIKSALIEQIEKTTDIDLLDFLMKLLIAEAPI